MLKSRPKPENKISLGEKLFDIIAILTAIFALIYLFSIWSELPDKVPIHFNLAGEPDGWGSGWTIIIPLTIGLILWIGMHIIEKYPHTHNYLWLTEENAQRQYRNSQLLLNILKNFYLMYFAYLTYDSVHLAMGEKSVLGLWHLPAVLLPTLGTIIIFIYRSNRLK